MKKILLLTGSPHKHGTSATLSDAFVKGAAEAGNETVRFDAAYLNVHPCIGCGRCRAEGSDGCVFKDDMEKINPHLLDADAIVFASPIYYYGVSAQLKTVIDRFYKTGDALVRPIKTAMMVTMEDSPISTADGALEMLNGIVGYLTWEIAGTVIATNCLDVEALNKTNFTEDAYNLGKNLFL